MRFLLKPWLPAATLFFIAILIFPLAVEGAELLAPNDSGGLSQAADWQARITEKATPAISYKTAPLISAKYIFWGRKWKWAGARMAVDSIDPTGRRSVVGKIRGLGIEVRGTVTSPKPNQLRFTWKLRAAEAMDNIIGGGLEFKLNLDSPALGGTSRKPELLPDKRGWVWNTGGGELRIEFDAPLPNINFDRGRKNKIRAMFVGKSLRRGVQVVAMTVTLPEGGRVIDLARRYGPLDTTGWYKNALLAGVSPVDLSFLNDKPAGGHGFVQARGNDFVFQDGSPVRFWGTNVAAYALFADKKQIKIQAKRLARLGYNLVRLHHHDSMAWVRRTVIDQGKDDSRQFDPEVVDRIDYWIKALKDEGVYTWLDLHVGRLFKRGDDLGPGADEILAKSRKPEKGALGKGYNYFNRRMEFLMQEFNKKYLTHVNPYTKLAYVDEPAIMGLSITNENDLTNHFGNMMLPNKKNPVHNKIFNAAVRDFIRKNTPTAGEKQKSWRQDWVPSWMPVIGKRKKTKGPYADTWKTWLPGPSKIFLADREWQWNRRMIEHLRSIGVKVPIATTQMWGNMKMHGLPPLTAGDMIDVHSYGKEEALSRNPRYTNNFISYMATGQLLGKPTVITEWNVPYPSVDRFTSPLYVASIASLQGWDAPMIYNYSQGNFKNTGRQGSWATYMDPALTGLMPAAALLYRQRHVTESDNTYLIKLNRKQLYYADSHPKNMASLRTLVERSKVMFGLPDVRELDWDSETELPKGAKPVTDLNVDFIPPGQDYVQSDTGELVRSWGNGYQSINTGRTQAVHGWIGGRKFQLKNVLFDIKTAKAAVVVSSLDGNSISDSRRLLVTALARAIAGKGGRKPLMSEPVTGDIVIRAPAGLRLYALAADGTRGSPLPVDYRENAYRLKLPVPGGTHWFMLE